MKKNLRLRAAIEEVEDRPDGVFVITVAKGREPIRNLKAGRGKHLVPDGRKGGNSGEKGALRARGKGKSKVFVKAGKERKRGETADTGLRKAWWGIFRRERRP